VGRWSWRSQLERIKGMLGMNRLGEFPGSYDKEPEDNKELNTIGKFFGITVGVILGVPVLAIVVGLLTWAAVAIWQGVGSLL
jgi:hypothetical protein